MSALTDSVVKGSYGLYVRILIAVLIILRSPQTGGMRIQNIKRFPVKSKAKALIASVIALTIIHDVSGTILNRLKISIVQRERARGVFSLMTMLLFLCGRKSETRPELVFSGSFTEEEQSTAIRQTSGEFVGRFLLLDSFATFSLTLFPYFDVENRVKGLIKRFAPRLVSDRISCSSCSSEAIVFPQKCFPCGHIYCYYCVKSEVLPFRCYRCNHLITSFTLSQSEEVL